MKSLKKSGFTLMELMVYMGIVGIVVVIAGEAFSNSTKFRIRTDNMIKASQEAENVAMLFREDVAQMGAKSARKTGVADLGTEYGVKFEDVNENVYMHPEDYDPDKKDSSSFLLTNDDGFSDLTLRRIRYDDNGYFLAVEEVRWYMDAKNKTLLRSCSIKDVAEGVTISDDDPCKEGSQPVQMASGVTVFNVEAANPGVKVEKSQLFPPDDMDSFRLVPRVGDEGYAGFNAVNTAGFENVGGTAIILSGFYSNYRNSDDEGIGGILEATYRKKNQAFAIKNESGSAEDNWSTLCDSYGKMTLHPDTVYEVSFDLGYVGENDKSLMFVPGMDHMSVGFRKAGSGDYAKKDGKIVLEDFMFFPPMDASRGTGKRSMRFTVPEAVDNVCLAFTFASFSPLVSQGKVIIKNVKIHQVATANYKFNGFDPELGANKKEKKNVKAFKLKLQVSRGAKNGGKGETGNVDLVVATPSIGPRD